MFLISYSSCALCFQPVFRANPRLWRSGFYSSGGGRPSEAPSPFGWNGGSFTPRMLPPYADSFIELARHDSVDMQRRALRGATEHSRDTIDTSGLSSLATTALAHSPAVQAQVLLEQNQLEAMREMGTRRDRRDVGSSAEPPPATRRTHLRIRQM